jgi:hypothetical protein
MGLNSEYSQPLLVVDLETSPLDCARDYVPPPDLDSIQAARNLKDPVKIAEDVAKRKAEAQSQYESALAKASLDFNLARIVALGWSEDGAHVDVETCETEADERLVLQAFWHQLQDRGLIGFRIRTFDAPMLMARSRYLGLASPRFDLGRYGRGGRIVDLWDVLTFGLSDYETTSVMPRRLKVFAQRYGLTVDDDIDGKDIGQLVTAGDWDGVRRHVESDVRLTAQLAQRLGVLRTPIVEVA